MNKTEQLIEQGNQLRSKGELQQALDIYNEAIKIDSKCLLAYERKGYALIEKGDTKQAILSFEQIISLNAESPQGHYGKAYALLTSKKYKLAIDSYNKVISLDPSHKEAYNDKGVAQMNLGDYWDAISSFQFAVQMDATNKDAYFNQAVIYKQLGQDEKALECLDKTIALDPRDLDAHHHKVLTLIKLVQYKKARECCDQLISLDPSFKHAHNNKGVSLMNLGKLTDALECYNTAISIDSGYIEAYYNKGYVLSMLGRSEEAVKCYNEVLGQEPNDVQCHYNKGLCLLRMAENDTDIVQAISCFERVIQIDPAHMNGYYQKGILQKQLGQLEEAIAFMDIALKMKPNYLFGLMLLAECYQLKASKNKLDLQYLDISLNLYRIILKKHLDQSNANTLFARFPNLLYLKSSLEKLQYMNDSVEQMREIAMKSSQNSRQKIEMEQMEKLLKYTYISYFTKNSLLFSLHGYQEPQGKGLQSHQYYEEFKEELNSIYRALKEYGFVAPQFLSKKQSRFDKGQEDQEQFQPENLLTDQRLIDFDISAENGLLDGNYDSQNPDFKFLQQEKESVLDKDGRKEKCTVF